MHWICTMEAMGSKYSVGYILFYFISLEQYFKNV